MKSYLRFLQRNKLYTAIELGGFAIALAFVFVITMFVVSELGYDKQLENTENIYIGSDDDYIVMSYTMGEMAQNSFPEVEQTCGILPTEYIGGTQMEVTVGDETFKQKALAVDDNFFDFFTFPFVEGEREKALLETNSVVISQSFANKYFNDKSALGQNVTIIIDGKKEVLSVSGVMEDFKRSVFPETDIFYGIHHVKNNCPNLVRNGQGSTAIFYKITEGSDINALEDKILEKAKEEDVLYNVGLFRNFHLSPFSQIHYGVSEYNVPFVGIINLDFVLLFMAAGLLLLVFAILNYISLTVAQVGFRAKEMATRQLLGEQRIQIVWRYIKEASMLTFAAFFISLFIVYSFQPYFNQLLGKELDIFANLTFPVVMLMLLTLFVIALLAGIIPALMVSKYKPINIVKGEFRVSTRMILGKWFMFFQNMVAIVTLCVSFAMLLQFNHILKRDGGYDKEGLILIEGATKPGHLYEEELKTLPFVESVGHVQFSPAINSRSNMSFNYDGRHIDLCVMNGDTAAFNMLNFRIISASNAAGSAVDNSYWLTESAMTALGLDYDATELLPSNLHYPVCGIMEDIQIGSNSLEECKSWNVVYCNTTYKPEENFNILRSLIVKVAGDENEALKQIRKFYEDKGLSNELLIHSHNEIYRNHFTSDENNVQLITIFTALTILLAAMAMLAMSTYFAKQHAKNYSIKRVFGYERRDIYFSMVGSFLKIVAFAAIISIPIAYYIVGEWLNGYSYRIGNHWWIYLVAIMIMAVVSVVTISWQAVRLVNANPVEELKKE